MLDKIAIARPYARAVFEQARQVDKIDAWLEMLNLLAGLVNDPQMLSIINNPTINRVQVEEMLINIAGERLSDEGRNLIRVLAVNNRLAILPEIADLYDQFKFGIENRLEAEVISAYPLEPTHKQFIIQALEKRFGQAINITAHVDQNLIAGAVIHIGDVVIDGSLRAGLTQMANELRI